MCCKVFETIYGGRLFVKSYAQGVVYAQLSVGHWWPLDEGGVMCRSRDPYALSDDDDELTAAAVATATAAAESL